ncbi:hypothetical protein G4G31_13610 [Massilia sp. Se16.2.3]|nr:hypothetical protein G4G31_13610 [Massilia sp. Se16.2.3]
MRRSMLWIAALLPAVAACARGASRRDDAPRAIRIGVLRLDARTDKCGVEIYDDKGYRIDGGSLVNLKNVGNSSFPGGERGLPAFIRATWTACRSTPSGALTGYGSPVIADYTAKVAERIPAEVLEFLRTKGGSLRLKIRLVDDGVLVGWDVEKIVSAASWKPGDGPSGVHYYMAGGDFREDQVVNGKVVERGWEHPPSSVSNLKRP